MDNNYGELYNINGWGYPYFTVNAQGDLCANPRGRETEPGQEIDVYSVIKKALARETDDAKKVQFPMILRFPDVLKNRLDWLHSAFNDAITYERYKSKYQGVFPIKVNQNKAVVQDLVNFGYDHSYGLEAGSKPELLIAMSCLTKAQPGAFLICNGYKDADYIALALSARAMGLNAIIVLEMEDELDIVIDQSEKLKIEPVIGIRAKLLTKIPGHFGSTSGKHGKFGLLEEDIYTVAGRLQGKNKLQWLKLLHFHVGSMIPSTEIVYKAATEAAGIYCNLVKKYGAKMTTLDCGGGLGIDYDGSQSGDMSVAYGLEQYASSIVHAVLRKCDNNQVDHPILCTESGRAMVSHHSMIILETLSAIPEPQDKDTHEHLLSKIQEISSNQLQLITAVDGGFADMYSHATDLEKHGTEMLKVATKLSKRVTGDDNTIYNYHMNFSVFSLVPDFWGIKQLFPMMPVSRLNEKPTCNGTLVDITCDSDGKIEKFIGGGKTLPLHLLDDSEPYYVAVLLSGAYQEALASKHNLFSGPTLVRAEYSDNNDGNFNIVSVDLGPTAEEIISTMRYNVQEDISTVIKKRALEISEGVLEMVEPLMVKGLTTMPYLIEHMPPRNT